MTVLSTAGLADVYRDFVAGFARDETINIVKADLRAAVAALDAYLADNAASINSAIPQPARANLTAQQKARLLSIVALTRYRAG